MPITSVIINILLGAVVWSVLIAGDVSWLVVAIMAASTYFAAFFTGFEYARDTEGKRGRRR